MPGWFIIKCGDIVISCIWVTTPNQVFKVLINFHLLILTAILLPVALSRGLRINSAIDILMKYTYICDIFRMVY